MEPEPPQQQMNVLDSAPRLQDWPQNPSVFRLTAQQKNIRLSSILSQTIPFMLTLNTGNTIDQPCTRIPTDIYTILDTSPITSEKCFHQYQQTIFKLLKEARDEDRLRFLTNKGDDSGLIGVRDIDQILTLVGESKRTNQSEGIWSTVRKATEMITSERKAVLFVFSHWFNKQNLKTFKDQHCKGMHMQNLSVYLMDSIILSYGIKSFCSYHNSKWNTFGLQNYRDIEECLLQGTKVKVGPAALSIFLISKNPQYRSKITFHHKQIKSLKDGWHIECSKQHGQMKYVGEIELPPSELRVCDIGRSTILLEAYCEFLNKDQTLEKLAAKLELLLYNEDEEFGDISEEIDPVTTNQYLVVKARQALSDTTELIKQKKYEKAQLCLQLMIVEIENSKNMVDPNLLSSLKKLYDLKSSATEFSRKPATLKKM